jgi:hypothetical protein
MFSRQRLMSFRMWQMEAKFLKGKTVIVTGASSGTGRELRADQPGGCQKAQEAGAWLVGSNHRSIHYEADRPAAKKSPASQMSFVEWR